MGRVLESIWTDIVALANSLAEWLRLSWEAGYGQAIIAVLIAIVLVALLGVLLSNRRKRLAAQRPELLISRGRVQGVENSTLTELLMHVSNLGDSGVQLLEVSVWGPLDPEPEVAEVSVLVPAHKSVDITVNIEEPQGDTGFLDLYFYAARGHRRTYRLRAQFTWEPWNERFKIEPLEQRVDRVRRLASTRVDQRRREEWKRRQEAQELYPRPVDPLARPRQRGEPDGEGEILPEDEHRVQEDTNVLGNGETDGTETGTTRLRFPSRF